MAARFSEMNVVKEIQRINEAELKRGVPENQSWHADYKDSAWVFVGGLPYNLTEGDIICVFSQWGEIEDIHLVRDEQTGKAKGFAFIKYEDQRSTNLVVDNANGTVLLGRTLRVDHKQLYEAPKKKKAEIEADPSAAMPARFEPGHAYKGRELASEYTITKGVDLFKPSTSSAAAEETAAAVIDDSDGHHHHRRRHRHRDEGDADAGEDGEDGRRHHRHRHRHHHRREEAHDDDDDAREGSSRRAGGERDGHRGGSDARWEDKEERGDGGRGGEPPSRRGDAGRRRSRSRSREGPRHGSSTQHQQRQEPHGTGRVQDSAHGASRPAPGGAATSGGPSRDAGAPPPEPPPARSWRGRFEVSAPPEGDRASGSGSGYQPGGRPPGGPGGRLAGGPGGGGPRPAWTAGASVEVDHVAGLARRR